MRSFRISALIASVLFVFGSVVCLPVTSQNAQSEPERIEVQAGGPAKVIKGEVKDRKGVSYVFKAKAGQKFSGRITRQSGDASFAITDSDGEALPEEEFDVNVTLKGSLTKTGDYKITVNTVNSSNSKYTLSIKVY
jgi:hypothetical protein